MATDAPMAATVLLNAWRGGNLIKTLPARCRPEDLATGYRIQDAFAAETGDVIRGYKIAATSAEGQAHIGTDRPIYGRLLESRMLDDGAPAPLETNSMCVAEAEFVFVISADIAARPAAYDWREVLDHVDALHLGIELPDSRFRDFAGAGAPQLIADNACAGWFVLGPAASGDWRDQDLAQHPVRLDVDGETVRRGTGADVLGDPRFALTWLVNQLSDRGIALRRGQVVTTGACGGPAPITPGQRIVADFGEFGQAAVTV